MQVVIPGCEKLGNLVYGVAMLPSGRLATPENDAFLLAGGEIDV